MVGFYRLTFSHILTLSVTEKRTQILFFTKIELKTSVLVGVRGHLLDHSGDMSRKWYLGEGGGGTKNSTGNLKKGGLTKTM